MESTLESEVNTMLYTVEQVANQLNVSKATIYNKIKLNQFKDKIEMKQGQTMLGQALINLIKDDIKIKINFNSSDNIDLSSQLHDHVQHSLNTNDIILDSDTIKLNKELIQVLIDQLKEKDSQLKESNERLKQSQKLNENSQILLKDNPKQETLLLEDHLTNLDKKLINIKDKMLERKHLQEQKSFFSKLFGQKN